MLGGRRRGARAARGRAALRLARWLCFGDTAREQADLGATALGGVFVGGPLTGGGVNPARALGPMLVSGQLDDFWLYIVGPLVGGALAAFVAVYALRAFQAGQDDGGDRERAEPRSRVGARRLG